MTRIGDRGPPIAVTDVVLGMTVVAIAVVGVAVVVFAIGACEASRTKARHAATGRTRRRNGERAIFYHRFLFWLNAHAYVSFSNLKPQLKLAVDVRSLFLLVLCIRIYAPCRGLHGVGA